MAQETRVSEGTSIPKPREEPKTPKPSVGKKARIALTGLAVLGAVETTGAIVNEQVNNQPVNAHTIIQDAAWPLNLRGLVRSKYLQRPSNEKTVITPENPFPNKLDTSSFTPITQEQAVQEIKNTNIADIENHTIKMFLPIDKETLDASPNLKYNQVQKAVIPPYLDETLRKQLETVKNSVQMDGLPNGAVARAPVGGKLSVIAIAGQKYENQNKPGTFFIPAYSSVRIDPKDNDGKQLAISMNVLGGEPLTDLGKPLLNLSQPILFDNSQGIEIKPGQPIFKVSKNNAIGGEALSGEKGQITINAFYIQEKPPVSVPLTVTKLPIPLTIDFLERVIVK